MKRFIGMLLVLVMMLTCAAAYASEGKYLVNTQTDPLNVRDAAGGGDRIGYVMKQFITAK